MDAMISLQFPRANRPPLLLSGAPERLITAHHIDEVRPALREVERAAAAGNYVAGYVSYEASPAFDPAFQVHGDARLPLLWFAVLPPSAAGKELPEEGEPAGAFTLGDWQPHTTRAEYDHAIARVHAAIAHGDSYQANYTLRLRAPFQGEDLAFFRQLRTAQQPSYSAYLNLGRYRILSVSPELFFHRYNGQLTTKPMKGTVRRGYTLAEDAELAAWLASSEKNRAENVMIVDLLRNDLSRIAELGSVRVPHLFEIEQYPTVFQMTSTVTATPRADVTLETIFGALFPCGSITGAPKISTMRLLQELEPDPREVYCGVIGVLCPDGEALFNVAIRTVWLDRETGTAEYGVGGGITWDSVAQAEYEEALTKAEVLRRTRPDFQLLETMRLEAGEYLLLERHLARLVESARYFEFECDSDAIRARLAEQAAALPAGAWRVRLLLARDGGVTVEHQPLSDPFRAAPDDDPPLPVALHAAPTFHHDRYLYHKTTRRELYDAARAAHPDAWDVLLWNEAGELMEFTIGNVVLELDGQRFTPPIASGALAGTFRADLLARGEIQERVLTREDLARATRVWLINSVRGWVGVRQERRKG